MRGGGLATNRWIREALGTSDRKMSFYRMEKVECPQLMGVSGQGGFVLGFVFGLVPRVCVQIPCDYLVLGLVIGLWALEAINAEHGEDERDAIPRRPILCECGSRHVNMEPGALILLVELFVDKCRGARALCVRAVLD